MIDFILLNILVLIDYPEDFTMAEIIAASRTLPRSVSYTHLDVYKRQGHYSSRYKDAEALAGEARRLFPEIYAAQEGATFTIEKRP